MIPKHYIFTMLMNACYSYPAFQGDIDYKPKVISVWNGGTDSEYIRIYNEMSTGDIWMEKQVQ